MFGKRLQNTDGMPLEAARASSAVTPCCRPAGGRLARLFPVGPIVMASPRACLASAPRCDMGDTSTSTGARRVWTGGFKDAWCDRASASPRSSQGLQRCRICQDTDGNRADGTRGAGFAREGDARDWVRGFEEVVPRPPTAVGTDWTHDVLRDSGAAAWAGPGASFSDVGGGFLGRSHSCLRTPRGYRDW